MKTNEKLEVIKSYGYVDELQGFRMTTFDLYRDNEPRAYMRCSDSVETIAIDKLYTRLHLKMWNAVATANDTY